MELILPIFDMSLCLIAAQQLTGEIKYVLHLSTIVKSVQDETFLW